jgi:hypothetical protein
MITIQKQESNAIYYSCDCGARGVCSFKPTNKDAAIVIDLKCPACQETECMTVLQYSNDKNRDDILKNINDIDLVWVPFINEELMDDGEDA